MAKRGISSAGRLIVKQFFFTLDCARTFTCQELLRITKLECAIPGTHLSISKPVYCCVDLGVTSRLRSLLSFLNYLVNGMQQ